MNFWRKFFFMYNFKSNKKALVLKNSAGFTLIEAAVALAVIGAVFVILQASINSIVVNQRVRYQELALRIANTKLEEVRALTYAAVPATGSFASPLLNSLPSGAAQLTSSDFDQATKLVQVVVSWQEKGSTSRNVNLSTLITAGGL